MVATLGVGPGDLLAADDATLDRLVELTQRQRTEAVWQGEVLALLAELVHALWRVTVQVHAKKGARLPPPLRVPRPWSETAPARPAGARITAGELARRLGGGRG